MLPGVLAGVAGVVAAAPATLAAPPQFLPTTARGCLSSRTSPGKPVCILLEVPQTEQQFSWGLQLRPPLPPLRGMWFPFSPAAAVRFWMHRTPAPLDMLFVSEGRVIAIQAAVPSCMRLPCRSYGAGSAVDGVMELAAGEAARLGIEVGSALSLEPLTDGGR
ncbi:MAG: DUF192 domain-containing protein [Cyanobacteriota bacterium]